MGPYVLPGIGCSTYTPCLFDLSVEGLKSRRDCLNSWCEDFHL